MVCAPKTRMVQVTPLSKGEMSWMRVSGSQRHMVPRRERVHASRKTRPNEGHCTSYNGQSEQAKGIGTAKMCNPRAGLVAARWAHGRMAVQSMATVSCAHATSPHTCTIHNCLSIAGGSRQRVLCSSLQTNSCPTAPVTSCSPCPAILCSGARLDSLRCSTMDISHASCRIWCALNVPMLLRASALCSLDATSAHFTETWCVSNGTAGTWTSVARLWSLTCMLALIVIVVMVGIGKM